MAGYDPKRSQINEKQNGSALATFLVSHITGDITEVPGVAEGNAALLAAGEDNDPDKVTTTHQLIGKYLSLRGPNVESMEHCDKFWCWLRQQGIVSYRGSIVNAIAAKV
ncbi:unnamed protein product [Chrysoparadoxa australica]